jgi:prepilin-type processing-associated H-X9-DG protein
LQPYQRKGWNVLTVTAVGGGGILVASMVLHAVFAPRPIGSDAASHRFVCSGRLEKIGLGLLQYAHDNHGWLPPAYDVDRESRPTASWRGLIAPYLLRRLRRPMDRTESAGQDFRCPDDPAGPQDTSYVVLVGSNTLFPGKDSCRLNDSMRPRGPSQTVLVIELPNSGIGWREPRDLEYADAIRGFGTSRLPISSVHPPTTAWGEAVINVCFADGHVEPVPLKGFGEFVREHAWIDGQPNSSPAADSP